MLNKNTEHPQTIIDETHIAYWAQSLVTQTPMLINKIMCNTMATSQEAASEGFDETLRFLFLCSLSSSNLTPSHYIDEIWHEFILFTRTYHQFCNEKFACFIHHQPSNNRTNEKEQYQKTLTLYRQYFGEPNITYWPTPNDDVANCGLCEN